MTKRVLIRENISIICHSLHTKEVMNFANLAKLKGVITTVLSLQEVYVFERVVKVKVSEHKKPLVFHFSDCKGRTNSYAKFLDVLQRYDTDLKVVEQTRVGKFAL